MPRNDGLTLIELATTIAVAAVLLAIAVPSFSNIILTNRYSAQSNDFMVAMQVARSEAIKRQAEVTISSATGTADWSQGWIVEDSVGNTLYSQGALTGGHTLIAANVVQFNFDEQGFIDSTENLDLCKRSGFEGRQIVVLPSGHTSVNNDYVCP